jgi:hypothetical protein
MEIIRPYHVTGNKLRVVIEDIRPYAVKLSPQVLQTIKYIGELEYRLKTARISYKSIPRSTVKEWAFNRYESLLLQPIVDKMLKRHRKLIAEGRKGLITREGRMRVPSFVWLDDRLITACMRYQWEIPFEKGRSNRYGLSEHSWQALALGTYWLDTKLHYI